MEEVLDPEAAELLGLERGQVTLQYHGGGGSLPGELGLLFGRRKALPAAGAHPDGRSEASLPLRPRQVHRAVQAQEGALLLHGFPPVERSGPEGERLMLANGMAMNYGFAFRLSAYASLRAIVRELVRCRRQPVGRRLTAQLDL